MQEVRTPVPHTHGHVGFVCWQTCEGVSSWRYYPWSGWASSTENGQLRSVTYKKLRNDTILRVTFHSAFGQYKSNECSEYYIQFGGRDCSQPARIETIMFIQNYGGSSQWHSVPAEVSGFCNATSEGQLLPGNIQVSVHIKDSCSGGDAYTGTASLSGHPMTSYLLIEEYCLWKFCLFQISTLHWRWVSTSTLVLPSTYVYVLLATAIFRKFSVFFFFLNVCRGLSPWWFCDFSSEFYAI